VAYKRISPQPVSEGGTGAKTLTGVLTGNGTSAVTANTITQYTVLLGDSSNAVSNVSGTGTSGQILTSNGAGSNPTWQTNSGGIGTWVLIERQVASTDATLDFTTGIDNTYDCHVFVINHITTDSMSSTSLRLLYSTNTGSSYLSTNYKSGFVTSGYTSASLTNENSNVHVQLSGGTIDTHNGISGMIYFYGLGTSSDAQCLYYIVWKDIEGGGLSHLRGVGNNSTTSGVDAIRFLFGTGNILSGSIALYGISYS